MDTRGPIQIGFSWLGEKFRKDNDFLTNWTEADGLSSASA
jgi:hypothetical protein